MSPMQCRHVTANYYVNPPWSTLSHRPCPPVPPTASVPPTLAVYCPMDGTLRRLERLPPPPEDVRPSPDDPASVAYVPMDILHCSATGSSSSQTGCDVIDAWAADNIYEPLSDVCLSEPDEE